MLKFFRFRYILTLAVILAVCCFIVSCGKNSGSKDDTSDAGTVSSSTQQTTAPPDAGLDIDFDSQHDFCIVKDGAAACRIVCTAGASSSDITLASTIVSTVSEATGVTLEVVSECGPDTEYEIVVGLGVYDKASQLYERVTYGQWSVATCGRKLIVFATDTSSFTGAGNRLRRYLSGADNGSLMLSSKIMGTETSTAIPVYIPIIEPGLYPAYIQNVGGPDTLKKCTQVAFKSVNSVVYPQYISRLEALGYEKISENEISQNLFTTLVKDKHMLTVGYLPTSRLMRVISEPAYDTYIGDLLSGERTGAVKVMQVRDPEHGHPGAYVITLADGRYFLYDTGYGATSETSTAPQLMEYMRKNNIFTDGKVHIAGIFISHPHPDHMGGITHLASAYADEIVCDAVMYNFVSVDMQSVMSDSTLIQNQVSINHAAEKLGAKVYCVRAGQSFTLSGTVFSVLFTPDELGDYPLTGKNAKGESDTNYDMNNSSVILTMSEQGQSVTFTGDCRGGEAAKVRTMYSRGFPGDIMTVAHHGYNVVATLELYKLAQPSVLLWPIRQDDAEVSRSFVKQLQAASYVSEHYYEDEQVELTLPYTPKG